MFDGVMPYYCNNYDESLLDELVEVINSEFPKLDMRLSLKDHSKSIVMPEDFKIPDKNANNKQNIKIAKNDKEASNLLWNEHIKNILVYSDKSFYFKKDGLWMQDVKTIESDIRHYVSNSDIYKVSDKGELIDYSQNRKNADNITKNILDIAIHNCDDAWVHKLFTSSLGKILFTNGYYDFKNSKFFKTNDEDYDDTIKFTAKIPFDLKINNFTEEDFDYINTIRERMFYQPFGDDVGNWYILQLARGLAGDCMKRFLVGIGSSNTGKSLLSSA
jgi:hypothetical protein